MKHLYVLMSKPEDMDMLWIKVSSFVSFFCSANLSCFMIAVMFKDKHKVVGDIKSLNLLFENHLAREERANCFTSPFDVI